MNLMDVYVVIGEYIYPDGKRGSTGADIWGVYSSLEEAKKQRDYLQRIEDEDNERFHTFPGYIRYRIVTSTLKS